MNKWKNNVSYKDNRWCQIIHENPWEIIYIVTILLRAPWQFQWSSRVPPEQQVVELWLFGIIDIYDWW